MNNYWLAVSIFVSLIFLGTNVFISQMYRGDSLESTKALSWRVTLLENTQEELTRLPERLTDVENNIDELTSDTEQSIMFANAMDDCEEKYSAKLWKLDEYDWPTFDYGIPPDNVVYRAVTIRWSFYYVDKDWLNGTVKCVDTTRLKKESMY